MVEVVEVLVSVNPCGHGRDIETEESAANGAKGGESVDVADLIHGCQIALVDQDVKK